MWHVYVRKITNGQWWRKKRWFGQHSEHWTDGWSVPALPHKYLLLDDTSNYIPNPQHRKNFAKDTVGSHYLNEGVSHHQQISSLLNRILATRCTTCITHTGTGTRIIHVLYVPHVHVHYITTYILHTCAHMYECTCERPDELVVLSGVILETKKQPNTVLLKYSYSPPENNTRKDHQFIRAFTCSTRLYPVHVPGIILLPSGRYKIYIFFSLCVDHMY